MEFTARVTAQLEIPQGNGLPDTGRYNSRHGLKGKLKNLLEAGLLIVSSVAIAIRDSGNQRTDYQVPA